MGFFRRMIRFYRQDIWEIRARDLPAPRRQLVKYLKIFLLSVRGFQADGANIRASALTMYTLLSIVPVLALLFGLAKGFGLDNRLDTWLHAQFPSQEEVLERVVEFARRMLADAKGGLVAGAGVVILLFSVVRMIEDIEKTFNYIWALDKARSWARKFSDYLSLILVGPFLVIGASSLNVYLSSLVHNATESVPLSEILSPLGRWSLTLGPFLLWWLLFSFLYIFLPNTKVRMVSGIFGGFLAALSYQVVQSLYVHLQVIVSKANAIYGSFAALPLFLVWLQTSWNIVLLGAELTHQHQYFESNEREEPLPSLSFRSLKRMCLGVSQYVAARFLAGENPPDRDRMAVDLRLPGRILGHVLRRLEEGGILVEVSPADPAHGEATWVPARSPARMTPFTVIQALENQGEDWKPASDDAHWRRSGILLDEFDGCMKGHASNRPLDAPPRPLPPKRAIEISKPGRLGRFLGKSRRLPGRGT